MELTSDIDQRARASDDIDIDLDLTDNNLQDGEDEFMSEEDMDAFADSTFVDGQVSHAANDDEMADDSYAQEQVDEEPLIPDEDIEDAEHTGPELDEDTIVEPDIDLPNDLSEDLLASYEETIGDQNHEQDYQEQEYNEQEHHERPTTPLIERDFINVALPNGQKELVNLSHVAEVATGETSDGYSLEVSNESTINHGAADQVTEPFDAERLIAPEVKSEQVQEEVLPASSDQEIVAPRNAKGSHTQGEDPLNSTDHLHPVVLDYQGEEMFLFPPIDQNGDHAATFLIADEDLAYSTIGNLLDACRGILKGSLSEQDELVININDLDLHISEVSQGHLYRDSFVAHVNSLQ